MPKLDSQSSVDRGIAGAVEAHLPRDFHSRLEAVLQSPAAKKSYIRLWTPGDYAALQTWNDEKVRLEQEFAQAYAAVLPEVLSAVDLRVKEISVAVAARKFGRRELVAAAEGLDRLAFFGPAVQERIAPIREMRRMWTMRVARQIAAALLAREGGAPAPGSPGPAPVEAEVQGAKTDLGGVPTIYGLPQQAPSGAQPWFPKKRLQRFWRPIDAKSLPRILRA
ncbi:MAG: hypothetical protein PHF00_07310, partial [Elusimicrobia bacterium]|nr:hypothetical protein [Elusimicrobiota bacterium]